MRTQLLLAAGLCVGLICAPARADDSTDLLREAEARVKALSKLLRPRSINQEILAGLAAADTSLAALKPPPKPGLAPVDPQPEKAAEENKRRIAKGTRNLEAYRKREEKLRSQWVVVLEKALLVQKVYRQTEQNLRTEVNFRALELLVATERADAATAVARTYVHAHIEALREQWSLDLQPRLLAALEKLRSLEALDLLRQILQMSERSSFDGQVATHPHEQVLRIIASYENVPGRLRHLLARDLVALYVPIEAASVKGGAAAGLWSRVSDAAIDVTWRLAGRPTHKTGDRLTTMHELGEWFRANRSRNGPAWRD